MKLIRSVTAIVCLFVLVTSCKKENGGADNTDIMGDYDFVGMEAQTSSSATYTEFGETVRSVTTSHYFTEQNTGTISITASEFISTGVGYQTDFMATSQTYINGVLDDEFEMPYSFTAPPTSGTTTYTRINSDSLRANQFIGSSSSGPTTPTGPVGVRISWSADTLVMRMSTTYTKTITQAGVPVTMLNSAIVTSKLKKKI